MKVPAIVSNSKYASVANDGSQTSQLYFGSPVKNHPTMNEPTRHIVQDGIRVASVFMMIAAEMTAIRRKMKTAVAKSFSIVVVLVKSTFFSILHLGLSTVFSTVFDSVNDSLSYPLLLCITYDQQLSERLSHSCLFFKVCEHDLLNFDVFICPKS